MPAISVIGTTLQMGAFVLALLTVGVGCGRVRADSGPVLESAGTMENGGAGNASGQGGFGDASGQGGVASAGGEGGVASAGAPMSAAGAGPVVPLPDSKWCIERPSTASCDPPCQLAYKNGFICPGLFSDLQVASTGLLIGWKDLASAQLAQQTFDFNFEAGLLPDGHFGPDLRRRVLAHDVDQNIVIEENENGLAISSPPLDLPGAGLLLAGRYEGETLSLLTKHAAAASELGALELLSVDRSGSVQNTAVYPSALDARFVAGLPASTALLVNPMMGASNALLWSHDAPVSLLPGQPSARAVANGGQIALAALVNGGVEVRDSAGTLLMSKPGGLPESCPSKFTAYYPDICQTKHPTAVSVRSPQRVFAATVIYAKGAPWLVSVFGESRAECHLVTRNACFESLPCDCDYELVEQDVSNTLELTRVDQPAVSYRVDLGVFQNADLWLDASDGGDIADFTVALARHDKIRVFVDYLLIHGQ